MQSSVTVPVGGKIRGNAEKEKRTKRYGTIETTTTTTTNSKNRRSKVRAPRQKSSTTAGQNSKSVGPSFPQIVALKAPSPSAPSPSNPPVTTLASSVPGSVQVPEKIPVKQVPGLIFTKQEAKGTRGLVKPKKELTAPLTEKPATKTTVRRKKNSNTNTSSIEGGQKTSSENDKKRHKSSPHSSSESPKRKSSEHNKSDGSKEPSDPEEKGFKQDLAQKFFKQLQENRQKARRRAEDSRFEKMPESSQLNISTRALRKKKGKKTVKQPLDSTIFKPNGEPVWVVADVPLEQCERNEEGEPITNPELVAALAEDDLDADEFNWGEIAGECMAENLQPGKQPSDDFEIDPYAPLETVEANSAYFTVDSLKYNTAKAITDLSRGRMLDSGGMADEGRRRRPGVSASATSDVSTSTSGAPSGTTTDSAVTPPTTPPTPDTNSMNGGVPSTPLASTPLNSERQLKTCVETPQVKIHSKSTVRVSYDRHHPLASVRKFRRKMGNTFSMEQTTQVESKEKS